MNMNTNMKLKTRRILMVGSFAVAAMAIPAPGATLSPVAFDPIGIPYAWDLALSDFDQAQTLPDHVGAWSWDEDGFPDTAKGWTHTSKWVKLDLTQPARFTLQLESLAGVPWPGAGEPDRLAGTNLFPSFSLYRGWDTDAGVTLDQDHTFNNRGNIEWAEDVTYLDHIDNSSAHGVSRTWVLPAGRYTINLGGNSPATVAEGRQGYRATFTTTPAPTLTIARSGSQVVVSWSAAIVGVQLYQTDTLGGTWSQVTDPPILDDGRYSVTLPPTAAAKFFNLQP